MKLALYYAAAIVCFVSASLRVVEGDFIAAYVAEFLAEVSFSYAVFETKRRRNA